MPRDLSTERRLIDTELDRAVFKGIERITENNLVLVFEKNGDAYELEVNADEDGLAVWTRKR